MQSLYTIIDKISSKDTKFLTDADFTPTMEMLLFAKSIRYYKFMGICIKKLRYADPDVIKFFINGVRADPAYLSGFVKNRRLYAYHLELMQEDDVKFLIQSGMNMFLSDSDGVNYIYGLLKRPELISYVLHNCKCEVYPRFYRSYNIRIEFPHVYDNVNNSMEIIEDSDIAGYSKIGIGNGLYRKITMGYSGLV